MKISTWISFHLISLCFMVALAQNARADAVSTFWVDNLGDNTNPCSLEFPCQSIAYVLTQVAEAGDIIKILPGIYREQIEITQSNLTIEGVGEGVYLFGAIQPDLRAEEGKFVANWSWGTSFTGTPFCSNLTDDISLAADLCNTYGFWQDETRLIQVLAKSEVIDGTFYYDAAAEQVWLLPLSDNPDLNEIEGLAHPYVVRLAPESNNVTLKNLNIWYGASMPDAGILQIEGQGHTIVDIDVRYSAGAGILVYGADQVYMENVTAALHGQNGWRVQAEASFSTSSGWEIEDWVDDLQLTRASSKNNGWKDYDNCWGGGGTKFSFTRNLSIDAFYSSDNNGFGIWLDIENHDYLIEQSMSARDAGRGIFVEYISDTGVVENNVIFGTRDADAIGCGISVGLAVADSREVLVKNNTVYSVANDVKGMMMKTGCSTCRSFPYPSEDITWENNLLINKDGAGFARDLDAGSNETMLYHNTAVEEEFAGDGSVLVCWDGLGNCTLEAHGIVVFPAGNYLADTESECGFDIINDDLATYGAIAFQHPRNDELCSDTPFIPIPPDASFSFSVDGYTASFTDASTDDGEIVEWAWDFGDGETAMTQHPTHVFESEGTYTVTLTIKDDDDLTDSVAEEVIADDPVQVEPPQANFDFAVDELSVSFTDTSSDDGEIISWVWDFGDGNTTLEQHPVHEFESAGTYTVMLTVVDDEQQEDNVSKEIIVDTATTTDPPQAGFDFFVDGLTASFTDTSTAEGSITSWAWNFGEGSTSEEQHPVHEFTEAGTYTVTLEVTDNIGLTASISILVDVTLPDNGNGAFIETNSRVVMEAEHFVTNTVNGQTGDEWRLVETDFDNQVTASMQALEDDGDLILNNYKDNNATLSFPISLSSTGTFYIWIRVWALENGSTVYVGCEQQSLRMGVSSDIVPGGEWSWYKMKNPGRRAQFEVYEAGEKNFNIWMREDGIYIDRIVLTADADFVPEGIGPAESPRLAEPSVVDKGNYLWDEVSLKNKASLPVFLKAGSVYPNPAQNFVNLMIDMPEEGTVFGQIYDMLGRPVGIIDTQALPGGWRQKVRISTAHLPAGIYFYRIHTGHPKGNEILTGDFVIARK